MSERKITGAERMRRAVRIINDCSESFLDRFTSEELLRLVDCMLASGWDIYPDQWARRQVDEALTAGKSPDWMSDERTPRYVGEQYRVTDGMHRIVFRGDDKQVDTYMREFGYPRRYYVETEAQALENERQAAEDDAGNEAASV